MSSNIRSWLESLETQEGFNYLVGGLADLYNKSRSKPRKSKKPKKVRDKSKTTRQKHYSPSDPTFRAKVETAKDPYIKLGEALVEAFLGQKSALTKRKNLGNNVAGYISDPKDWAINLSKILVNFDSIMPGEPMKLIRMMPILGWPKLKPELEKEIREKLEALDLTMTLDDILLQIQHIPVMANFIGAGNLSRVMPEIPAKVIMGPVNDGSLTLMQPRYLLGEDGQKAEKILIESIKDRDASKFKNEFMENMAATVKRTGKIWGNRIRKAMNQAFEEGKESVEIPLSDILTGSGRPLYKLDNITLAMGFFEQQDQEDQEEQEEDNG